MSETQDVFELRELSTMSFLCQTCGTELVFRADRNDFCKDQKITCPCCGVDLIGADLVLTAYRALQAQVKSLKVSVNLRGPKRTA